MADSDITKMKVADLKRELKNRGLSIGGNKNELVERLQNALVDGSVDGGENHSHISDDLLDDELDDDLDEKDDLLQDDHEDELLNPSPESEKKKLTLKLSTKPTETSNSAVEKSAPAKKVSLKRNLQIQTPVLEKIDTNDIAKESGAKHDTITMGEPLKKVSKIAELSAAERRQIRLQKFGNSIPTVDLVADDEKKAARAARFGLSNITSGGASKVSAASITSSSGTPELEKLQKRAERFGATTSTKLSEVEMQERLKKRQERFGAATTVVTASNDKMQKRLERFKAAA